MKKNIKTLFLLVISVLILLLPDIILHADWEVLGLLTVISKICLFCFGGLILLQITKSYFLSYLTIGSFYVISSVPEIINAIALGWYMNTDGMKALYHTSESEITEFINMFNTLLLIPVLVVVAFVTVLFLFRKVKFNRLKPRVFILLISSFALILVFQSIFRVSKKANYYTDRSHVKFIFQRYYVEEHPFNFYYRIYHLYAINKRNKEYKKHREHFDFKIQKQKSAKRPDVLVFVIGESMRYKNWSINGYHRNTDPQLAKENNLISYSKHFSNANSTSNAFPLLLTQAFTHNFKDAYKQKNIVTLFKEAGYRTAWISSTADVMEYLDNRDEPDEFYDLRDLNDLDDTNTDGHIVSVVNEVVNARNEEPLFIVINMRGAHDVAPSDFVKYSPNSSEEIRSLSTANAQVFINDYDNLILSQDDVLAGVIDVLKSHNMPSAMLFTSDHATHLFDEGHSLYGYGSSVPTEIETHIPLFAWGSEQFIDSFPVKYGYLEKHKDVLSTNNNLFYTLADLGNIQFHELHQHKSLADSLYSVDSTRFVFVGERVFEFKDK